MDDNSLPSDVTECHRLLLAAFKQSVQLERQVADAKQQATELRAYPRTFAARNAVMAN